MSLRAVPRSSLLVLACLALAPVATGCGVFRRLAGNDVVPLDKAEMKAMSVDIRRPTKTICPREDVQMAVVADIVLDGESGVKRVETWQGRGSVNKNDKLDFDEFSFQSAQGRFDAEGWFSPDRNLLATAGTPFEIRAAFRRRPDKFTFTQSYKPDYACIKEGGAAAKPGEEGARGADGLAGQSGASGSSSRPGGKGGDGASGGPGANGSHGASGVSYQAYVSMVKTPFHERLVGIVLSGDVTDFLLVPEGQTIVLVARGGDGGAGGAGGNGGQGGQGGSGNPGGSGGAGGIGGPGGNGGNGGSGGTIDLMVDMRYPALRSQIQLDVGGGAAGAAGSGGGAGAAGAAGSGQMPSSGGTSQSGVAGTQGSGGTPGKAGRRGHEGKIFSNTGNVSDMFANRANITPL